MRVIVYPADMGRCGHRLIWPVEALIAQGADVRLVLPTDAPEDQLQAQWGTLVDGTRALVDVVTPDADVVVFQRPLQRTLVESIPKLQRAGVLVVVEVDDDFTTISPNNISWTSCHPASNPDRNWQWLAQAAKLADLVTVTTPALARRYGRHGRVAIVPNHVPASYLDVKSEPHEDVIVGWTGSVETHPDDLQETRGGVARALQSTGASFAVVGTGRGVQRRLDLAKPPAASGWMALQQYPEAVAQIDVGIVPLADTAFNQAKSGLKMLEFAALGVAVVASSTDDNLRLHEQHGIGLLAKRPREWEGHVRRLVLDADLRAEHVQRGREAMAGLTVEANAGRWLEAWESAGERSVGAGRLVNSV